MSGGWLAAAYDSSVHDLDLQVHASFRELLSSYPDAACVAVDILIGLPRGEPRAADGAARRVLGSRRSSVFPAPDLRLLDAVTDEALGYEEASVRSRSISCKGISRQAFAIFPKIAAVNPLLAPQMQDRVVEIHPEVSFWALAGHRPMTHPKKTQEGFEERRSHLSDAFPSVDIPTRQRAGRIASPAKADDVLDAIVAAWTARRVARGEADRLPAVPPTDARGLRMEIVY